VGEFSHYSLLFCAPRYVIVLSGGSAGVNAYSVHVLYNRIFFFPYFHLFFYSLTIFFLNSGYFFSPFNLNESAKLSHGNHDLYSEVSSSSLSGIHSNINDFLVVVLSLFRQILVKCNRAYYSKLNHYRFLSKPFKSIIYYHVLIRTYRPTV